MTLTDLMMAVCNGSEKNAETNLRRWLNKLIAAGLLTRERVDDGKLTSNGTFRYTLVKDVGPKAPVTRESAGEVYDPNSGKVISLNSHNQDSSTSRDSNSIPAKCNGLMS
ncbi:hypothetical protein, partial [Methylomonas koyamae]